MPTSLVDRQEAGKQPVLQLSIGCEYQTKPCHPFPCTLQQESSSKGKLGDTGVFKGKIKILCWYKLVSKVKVSLDPVAHCSPPIGLQLGGGRGKEYGQAR